MRLLIARGAKFAGTNALARMPDFEDLDGLRICLGAGADQKRTGATAFGSAIWPYLHDRDPEADYLGPANGTKRSQMNIGFARGPSTFIAYCQARHRLLEEFTESVQYLGLLQDSKSRRC